MPLFKSCYERANKKGNRNDLEDVFLGYANAAKEMLLCPGFPWFTAVKMYFVGSPLEKSFLRMTGE